ncbi:ISSfl3 OrfC [Escherichia coli TA008]|nr:transposase [Escherichia coli TA007]OSL68481.1 ISSfl3 OrfC [Escherichia coli TA008]
MNNELPDDIELLKAMLRKQQSRLRQYTCQVAGYEQEIERLKAQLDRLRRMLFCQSSEKKRHKLENQIRQAEKRLSELENRLNTARNLLEDASSVTDSPDTSPPSENPIASKPESLGRKSSRKPLPAELPRETHRLLPAETSCPACGGVLKEMGETISEQLDIINTAFKVIETIRPKLACSRCDHIVQAPVPSKPIARSYAGAGLLAHIVTGKYADHLPLYRQSEIYRRQGVELSRATLGRWTGAVAELPEPLYDVLRQYVLMPGKVHADDIPVPVQEPGSGKTRTARLWVYVRDDRNAGSSEPPAVWFAYSPDRQGKHPVQHLRPFRGILQADAFSGYDRLFSAEREGGALTEVACWAHARRKIHDVYISSKSTTAEEALKRISELYAIDDEIRGLPESERLAARQQRSKALLTSLHEWMVEKNGTLSKKSRLGEAFSYVLNQWDALCYYSDDRGRRRTITQQKERFVPSVSGKRITCSSATIMEASAELCCTD